MRGGTVFIHRRGSAKAERLIDSNVRAGDTDQPYSTDNVIQRIIQPPMVFSQCVAMRFPSPIHTYRPTPYMRAASSTTPPAEEDFFYSIRQPHSNEQQIPRGTGLGRP